jgi:hypothetical protein
LGTGAFPQKQSNSASSPSPYPASMGIQPAHFPREFKLFFFFLKVQEKKKKKAKNYFVKILL